MKKYNLTKQDILGRIGYFKNKKGISSYELSLRLGHNKTYFYRVESGEINLTIDQLLQVLEILGVSTFEFFYPDLDGYNDDLKNLDILNSLNEDEKQSLMTILKIKR